MRRRFWALSLLGVLGAARAEAYDEVAVKDVGSIQGTVRFEGKPPEPQKVAITKDPQVCGDGVRLVGEVAADAKGNLKGAVVYIEKVASGKPWPKQQDGFRIDQKGCRFLPNTLVMRKGHVVHIKNKDKVFHNIHAYEVAGSARLSMFNDGQQADSEFQHDLRLRRGNEVKLECDAHNFMHEWFLVLEHPYFSPTGADGKFSIGDVPPGTYKLMAWHPVLGRQEAGVEVKPGGKAAADFTFKRP
jgi:plastocyanin